MGTLKLSASLLLGLILLVPAALGSSFSPDARYHRELEQQTKSDQARSLRRQLLAQDFARRPAVGVDAYRFDLKISPADTRLAGTVTLDLVAQSDLSEVDLDAVGLEISKAWFINALGVKSEARFEDSTSSLKVDLPVTVARGARFSVAIAYSVTGDKRDGRATEFDRGLFFVNADKSRADVTPTVYTSTEPQLARTWFPCIDTPDAKARTSVMRVTAPDGWYVVSNGALKSVEAHPETQTVTFEWNEGFQIPTYLISLAVAPYTVIEDRLGSLPVQYFVPKSLEEKARVDFGRTPQFIDYFQSLWLPYPYEKYSMATVPHYTGAMEHTTATTMSDALVNGDQESEDTVAHELSHHWWGDLVTPVTWDDLWLNEGFATHAEVLYAEKFKGADAAKESLLWDRGSYFKFDPDGKSAVVDPKVAPDDKFSPAVYEKGAWVLHMLRQLLGDAAFFGAERDYLKKFAFGNVTSADLEKAFEAASGLDLSGFFQQWVFSPGYPVLAAGWSYDPAGRTVKLVLDQKGRVFKFPLDVVVAGADARGGKPVTLSLHFDVAMGHQEFTQVLPVGFPAPSGVAFDPDLKLLKKLTVTRQPAELAFWFSGPAVDPASWLTRVEVLDELDHGALSLELARELAGEIASEASASVRAEIYGVLGQSRKLKGMTDADFSKFQGVLRAGLTDGDTDARIAAAEAAENYLSPELADYVATRFAEEQAVRAKARLALTLARARHPRAFELFYAELQKSNVISGHRKLLQSILEGFGILGDTRAAAILSDYINGTNPYMQTVALESLGSLAVPETFSLIVDILHDLNRTTDLRVSSAKALGNYGGIEAARVLHAQLLVEKNETVKAAIKAALDRLGGAPDLRDLSVKGSPALLQW